MFATSWCSAAVFLAVPKKNHQNEEVRMMFRASGSAGCVTLLHGLLPENCFLCSVQYQPCLRAWRKRIRILVQSNVGDVSQWAFQWIWFKLGRGGNCLAGCIGVMYLGGGVQAVVWLARLPLKKKWLASWGSCRPAIAGKVWGWYHWQRLLSKVGFFLL